MDWGETRINVRYQETDQMGVVYHANYFVWFEVARTEMMKKNGFNYRELEERGVMLPVVDVSCKYHHPSKYDDHVIVRARIKEYKGIKINIEYEAIREQDGKLLATGETKHVWVNKELKPVRLEKIANDFHNALQDLITIEAKGRSYV